VSKSYFKAVLYSFKNLEGSSEYSKKPVKVVWIISLKLSTFLYLDAIAIDLTTEPHL